MLYVVRHGETLFNRAGRIQGHSDSPLTLKGVEQAKHYSTILKEHLKDMGDFNFVVSPIGRTRQTAQIVLDSLEIKKDVIIEPLAKEKYFGEFEGMDYEAFHKHYNRQKDNWNYRQGEEESEEMFYNRVSELLEKYKNTKTILVTHGGVSLLIRSIISKTSKDLNEMISKYGWQQQDEIFHIKNASEVIKLKADRKI